MKRMGFAVVAIAPLLVGHHQEPKPLVLVAVTCSHLGVVGTGFRKGDKVLVAIGGEQPGQFTVEHDMFADTYPVHSYSVSPSMTYEVDAYRSGRLIYKVRKTTTVCA